MASVAGSGVTDLKSLPYPLLDLHGHGKNLTWDQTQIGKTTLHQRDCLIMIVIMS